jgi:hypothetical protein
VEVWRSGVRLLDNLPIGGGNVRATLQSRVTRNLDLALSSEWFPESPTDLLAPFGSEIRAWRGVSVGGITNHPSFVWPVFRGPITKVDMDTQGSVSLNAVDLAGEVAGAAFEAPFSVPQGSALHTSVRSVISEAYEAAEFDTFTLQDRTLPALAWDEDRGKALDEMAAGAGGFWYALADGRFTLREVPWIESGRTVDLTVDSALPIFRSANIAYSRDNVYNTVVVRSERTDGSTPGRYVARDTDPASPIVYGGAYGRKVLHTDGQSAFGAGGLQIVGDTVLLRSKALAQSWSATIVPYPPLELGDLLQMDIEFRDGRRRRSKQVVAGFTIPLTSQGDMSLDLRSLMPRGEALV